MHFDRVPVSYASDQFTFQPIREQDLPLLREWLLRPHVAEWWGPAGSIDELRGDFVTHAREPDATRAYIVFHDAEPIGFIQSYVVMGSGDGWWENETDPGARGTDQFLADPNRLDQGLGSAMIRSFLVQLFSDQRVTVIQTDPHPTNARAIAAYARAGFLPVRQVTTPDGAALLMRCIHPVETN